MVLEATQLKYNSRRTRKTAGSLTAGERLVQRRLTLRCRLIGNCPKARAWGLGANILFRLLLLLRDWSLLCA